VAQGYGSGLWLRALAQGYGSGLWLRAVAQGFGSGLWLRAVAQESALFCHSEGLNAPKNLLSRPFGFASGSDDYSISLSFRLSIII